MDDRAGAKLKFTGQLRAVGVFIVLDELMNAQHAFHWGPAVDLGLNFRHNSFRLRYER
jgi:hypothetical protein